MDTDVVVIGLGSVGSMAAWHLARRGVDVVGVDQFGLGHDRGAFAGESRLFRTAYHEGADYVPMLLAARDLWLELERGGERRLFHDTGVLSIGAPEIPQMTNVLASVRGNEIPHVVYEAADLKERFPVHGSITNEIGVLDRLGGVLRPEAAVLEALRQAEAAGATVLGNHEVLGIDSTSDGVSVVTSQTTIRARHAIVASGVWSCRLLPRLSDVLTIKPLVLTWFAPSNPQAFAPDVFPGFIRDLDEVHLFGIPSLDGVLVKAGWADRWDAIAAPEELVRFLGPAEATAVGASVHRLLPSLPSQPSRHSVHMDIYSLDRRALIGRIDPAITVATGFSGHGFKLVPVFGELAADLATGQTPRQGVEMFDPGRFR